MTSFNISIPFKGEVLSTFKLVSDFYSYLSTDSEKCSVIDDEKMSFSMPITFGVFRLLLDGELEVIDRDYENHVGLYRITSKDRGGKGKLDSNIKLFIDENDLASNSIVFEFDAQAKGLINRVDLKMAESIENKLIPIVKNLVEANTSFDHHIDLIKLEEQESKDGPTKPLWVMVLQFPANIVANSVVMIRDLAYRALKVAQKSGSFNSDKR